MPRAIFGTTLQADDLTYCRCLTPVHESWESCPTCGIPVTRKLFQEPGSGDGLSADTTQ